VNRLGAILLLAVLALLGSAGTASAHATLISSDPADGATLPSAPAKVTLVFDEPLPQGLNTVAITGPGNTRWETGEVTTTGNSISVAMRPSGPAGEYTVGYRIVSPDGHPLTGTVRFRLTATAGQPPATTTTTAAATQATQTSQPVATASQSGDGSTPIWPWVLGVMVLVIAGALVAVRLRRGSRAS